MLFLFVFAAFGVDPHFSFIRSNFLRLQRSVAFETLRRHGHGLRLSQDLRRHGLVPIVAVLPHRVIRPDLVPVHCRMWSLVDRRGARSISALFGGAIQAVKLVGVIGLAFIPRDNLLLALLAHCLHCLTVFWGGLSFLLAHERLRVALA